MKYFKFVCCRSAKLSHSLSLAHNDVMCDAISIVHI